MGNISDEFRDSEPKLEKVSDAEWVMDGNYYLDDLNEKLGLKMESDDFETIGGLLIDSLGAIADDGEESEKKVVYIDNCKFTVESWKDRRIETVKLELLCVPVSENGEDSAPEGQCS